MREKASGDARLSSLLLRHIAESTYGRLETTHEVIRRQDELKTASTTVQDDLRINMRKGDLSYRGRKSLRLRNGTSHR